MEDTAMTTTNYTHAREGLARRLRDAGFKPERAERCALSAGLEETNDAALDAVAVRIVAQSPPEEFVDGSRPQSRQFLHQLKSRLIKERQRERDASGTKRLDERLGDAARSAAGSAVGGKRRTGPSSRQ
jgi:hypothetical protein